MKYRKSFEEFENDVLEGEENFEKWDDYMEWKAYLSTYKDRMKNLKDLESAEDIKIITK
mgnify:CR=1 FL=1